MNLYPQTTLPSVNRRDATARCQLELLIEGRKQTGLFISRPNRFLALISINGETIPCYLPDPGRLTELLTPGVQVVVRTADHKRVMEDGAGKHSEISKIGDAYQTRGTGRKTEYDILAVVTDVNNVKRLVSVDTRLPNALVREALFRGELTEFKNFDKVRSEFPYGTSRLDFMLEEKESGNSCLLEVKGCNLVINGVAMFPDAPTDRGRRHLRELIRAKNEGAYSRTCMLFIVQRDDAEMFTPNKNTDSKFARTLELAVSCGVETYAHTARLTEDHMCLSKHIPFVI